MWSATLSPLMDMVGRTPLANSGALPSSRRPPALAFRHAAAAVAPAIVRNVQEAMRVLLNNWPDAFKGTDRYEGARKACHAVIIGQGMAGVARGAFLKAAREAGLLEG